MFSGSFREAAAKGQVVKNVSGYASEELLTLIYTGDFAIKTSRFTRQAAQGSQQGCAELVFDSASNIGCN